ncbi:hypothetical protein StoSoilB5_02780 [Arthrobacter sp. StoSoilB5]|nr:hypothetical protein StoSoilB5_02780 [Arthrobacter sp. StoSoilB5]
MRAVLRELARGLAVTALLAPASDPVRGEAPARATERVQVWDPAPWWDRDEKGPAGIHSRSNAPQMTSPPMKLARDA